MKRLFSEELMSESMGSHRYSTPTRPHSTGVLADECTLDSIGSSMRVLKSPARTSVGQVSKRRRDGCRVSRESRRPSAACHVKTTVAQFIPERIADLKVNSNAKRDRPDPRDLTTRPELQRSISNPVAGPSNAALDSPAIQSCGIQNQALGIRSRECYPIKDELTDGNPKMGELGADWLKPKKEEDLPEPTLEMFRQPDTHPITEDQLIKEVRGIYTGLVMVEKKCMELDKQQAESRAELLNSQWQVLVSVHRTLLYEHHDFFLASQHPSAGPVLKNLAEKYAMPARMWKYAIHSFLELLRQKLPGSVEYMLDFIYLSYSMMTLLLESVPGFKETWIECLGDLARYRMAVEEFDKKDRDLWAGVSRYWYNQDANRSPENGRIQHHLAVLSRPDILQQFFHYTKALISVRPFPNARDSIVQLLAPLMNTPTARLNLTTLFVTAHGALLMQKPAGAFAARAYQFLVTLRRDIVTLLGQQKQIGVQITSCNIAAIFQYGNTGGVMETEFTLKERPATAEERMSAMQWASSASPSIASCNDISSQLVFQASSLAFHTLIVMLDQTGDQNMYPSVHISMAFIWCLTLNPSAIQRVEPLVPWAKVAAYLNGLFEPDIIINKIENEQFPLFDDTPANQLPEDFLIKGQAWSRLYYPERFFEDAPSEDDRPTIEDSSIVIPRRHRCLWLGVRIATVCLALSLIHSNQLIFGQFARWITYDQTRRFGVTQLAASYTQTAENTAHLDGCIYPFSPRAQSQHDQQMQDV
ncbi:unnamed protein product [Penicillium salamii]|uniref:DNA/RNA-binding domain-containing protein n=1 Tax=Penicillium salamii TaxID=1612424 RepID=A0A9W4JWW4_9EURO|nr:unnamed protein product [Penicillium salamii]CAG8371160.1 unnamed protein product [Penicillium salamii]CAG8386956.1 unnamed protein product [Penicillium salamii]CAG8424616.1 unnamed protein product [Penicillium salamii]